jgi:hypothetical protein
MKVLILILIGVVALPSCSSGGVAVEFYVVIKPDETERFLEAVRVIAKENGLDTSAGQAVADTGKVLRVVEGNAHGVRLWVQNISLSGKENPKLCGAHFEPYPDPSQFMVFTEPRFFGSKAGASELGERVRSQLQKSGFDVRREPVVCGLAAIQDRS